MVQRQVWRHHCLISEPECLTHSRHQDSTHTRTSTIKTSRPEWEVIKAWWDKMTFNRDRVMKWKADFFRFPGVLGGPINYGDKSELSRCLFGKWPPCTFPRSLSHLYFKSSYWSTFTSHWLRGLALRHVLYRLKGAARPIIISIKWQDWPSEHFTAHHERQKYFIASKLLYLASGIFELELAIVEA